MAERVSSLLRRSVEHLADEVPDSYRLLLDELGPLVVELDIEGELFSLRGGQRLQVADGPMPAAGTRIATSRAAMLDVIDAKMGLAQAVESDALLAYVHAAVRAPSQPKLLAALRVTTS